MKVQAVMWLYLKQITGTDRFLMLLSKLDQRREAAFVHIRTGGRRDVEGWGREVDIAVCGLVFGKTKARLSLHSTSSPYLSLNCNLRLFFCLCPLRQ